jgi:hypothetical protein
MIQDVSLSSHALHRSAQRNISEEDIEFIIQNGDRLHRTGVIFCQLRHRNIPVDTPGNHRGWKLVGTTVVLCKCGLYVVTLYREKKAFQRDSRKAKYNQRPEIATCPCCGTYAN